LKKEKGGREIQGCGILGLTRRKELKKKERETQY
jgi:hypothetical protein